MGNARLPGPLKDSDHKATTRGPLGCAEIGFSCRTWNAPGPIGIRDHRPIRVADASKKDSKQPPKKPSAPAKASTVHLHFYLLITSNYSATQYYEWLRGPVDPDH